MFPRKPGRPPTTMTVMQPVARATIALGAVLIVLLAATPTLAAPTVTLTTPYPAVAVEPGGTTTFDLTVDSSTKQRVGLSISKAPDGWTATLRGGGFVIDGVFTDPKNPPDVQLEVQVPADVEPGTFQVAVTGKAGSASDTLTLELRVAESVPGGLTLTTDFPGLRGAPDQTFSFDVTLTNNMARETTFTLEAAGPPGWQVDARPSGQQQAATARVAAGGTETLSVTADPPDDAVAGDNVVEVRVTGGGQTATLQMPVQITGKATLTLTTPDQRLNTDATAGEGTRFTLVVANDGSAALTGVTFSSAPPEEWEVTFAPETLDAVQPGQSANVVATITPAGNAVAGDYNLSITATSTEGGSQSVDIRTTVKTSGIWGIVGILLIVAAVAGLGWVFRRYGRR